MATSKVESGIDGKAFRKAVRQEKLGEEDVERVWKGSDDKKHDKKSVDVFLTYVRSRLELPNVDVVLDEQGVVTGSMYNTELYRLVSIVSEFEKPEEDFGAEDEGDGVEIIKQPHSFVNSQTGSVYLVEAGAPAIHYGPRCNTNDTDSYSFAVQEKGGMMLPFRGQARILLELGISVDCTDGWGETALMGACHSLNTGTIQWLLNKGANPNLATLGSLVTALHRAVEAPGPDEMKKQVVKILLDHGADPSPKNSWGATPLHVAAYLKLPETCQLLLSRNAQREAKDSKGRTPASMAKIDVSTSSKRESSEKVLAILIGA